MLRPLTKRRLDNSLYTRRAEVEALLADLVLLSREAVIARAKVRDPANPEFLPPECLVYLLRETRSDNNDAFFRPLYLALMDRIDQALPRAQVQRDSVIHEDLTRSQIRDQVRHQFQVMLVEDRNSPGDKLDFYEAQFASGIAKLRATAREKAWREQNRSETLEYTPDGGELSLEVECAAGSLDLDPVLLSDDPGYRLRLEVAIDALPREQSRIIEMLRAGMPQAEISKLLGCALKTVYNRREAAITALRQALGLGAEQ